MQKLGTHKRDPADLKPGPALCLDNLGIVATGAHVGRTVTLLRSLIRASKDNRNTKEKVSLERCQCTVQVRRRVSHATVKSMHVKLMMQTQRSVYSSATLMLTMLKFGDSQVSDLEPRFYP